LGLLLKAAAQSVGGKGGGQAQIAQGGGPQGGALDTALHQALEAYTQSLA